MRDSIIEDLAVLHKVFTDAGVQFFMQEGNALGYGRFKDIIEADTDVDIGVAQEVDMKTRRLIFKGLAENHYSNFMDSGDFIFAVRKVKLNIWFYHKDGHYYVAYPESTPGIKFVWPEYFYDTLDKAPLHGIDLYTPHDLPLYLMYRYGEDWETKFYKTSEAWKSVEEYVFKWKHKMEIEKEPTLVNKRWLEKNGRSFGEELLTLMKPSQPISDGSVTQIS